jgi:serine phosphatase RsbU (regulator of sigma subunit)
VSEATTHSSRRGTILIADDSLVIRAAVRDGLESEGYTVHESDDGAGALAMCNDLKPDAVLLDVEMPGLDGRAVLKELKSNPELADIPVVFLTGRTATDDIVAGLRAGAHDYLKKPFEPEELLARVGSAVQIKQLQDELRRRNAELTDELVRAEVVQRSLLPRWPPAIPGFEVAGCCIPAAEVGGDFFDWFPVGDSFQITLADVMGKGVAAALIAASARSVLRTTLLAPALADRSEQGPLVGIGDAVTLAARAIEPDLEETSSFITLFTGRLDVATGRLTYVDAGHGLTAVIDADGIATQLTSSGMPVGIMPGDSWTERHVDLQPGDTLISVSDGVLDFFDSALEVLDAASVLARGSDSAQQATASITRFARSRRIKDDITAIVVRRSAVEP